MSDIPLRATLRAELRRALDEIKDGGDPGATFRKLVSFTGSTASGGSVPSVQESATNGLLELHAKGHSEDDLLTVLFAAAVAHEDALGRATTSLGPPPPKK